jgi:hypothetical protein
MKIFVLTEEALTEIMLGVANYTNRFSCVKRENYIKTVIEGMAEYETEVIISTGENLRIRLVKQPEEQ